MATLSGVPTPGPTLPDGCTKVTVAASKPAATEDQKVDVTTLSDTARVYADPVLIDAGPNGDGGTQTVTAEWYATGTSDVTVSAPGATGWVCTSVDYDFSVGEFIKGTATWTYVAPET